MNIFDDYICAVDNIIMISSVIKEKIEEQFGQTIRYSKDCEVLARDISCKTGHTVSGSTIKRLMGFVKGVQEPRMYTMDVIADYLGHPSFEDLIKEFDNTTYSEFSRIEELSINEMKKNQQIKFTYKPDREVIVKYLNNSTFEVMQSLNSKLQQEDLIKFNQIVLSYPLFIKDVIRKDKSMGQYIAGKISGITSIEKLKDLG